MRIVAGYEAFNGKAVVVVAKVPHAERYWHALHVGQAAPYSRGKGEHYDWLVCLRRELSYDEQSGMPSSQPSKGFGPA